MFLYNNKNNLPQSHTMAVLKLVSHSKVRLGPRLHCPFISKINSICSSIRTSHALWPPKKKKKKKKKADSVPGCIMMWVSCITAFTIAVCTISSFHLRKVHLPSCASQALPSCSFYVLFSVNDSSISWVNQDRNLAIICGQQRYVKTVLFWGNFQI